MYLTLSPAGTYSPKPLRCILTAAEILIWGGGMKRFLLCPSPPLHTQIFDFACDPQPLKASVGLFHTTDLCSQSRCLKHNWHRSLTGNPEREDTEEICKNAFKIIGNFRYLTPQIRPGSKVELDMTSTSDKSVSGCHADATPRGSSPWCQRYTLLHTWPLVMK